MTVDGDGDGDDVGGDGRKKRSVEGESSHGAENTPVAGTTDNERTSSLT